MPPRPARRRRSLRDLHKLARVLGPDFALRRAAAWRLSDGARGRYRILVSASIRGVAACGCSPLGEREVSSAGAVATARVTRRPAGTANALRSSGFTTIVEAPDNDDDDDVSL